MAKDPAFLFYPSDFKLGTLHMNFEEKGAYLELMCLQFSRGRFTLIDVNNLFQKDFEKLWGRLSDKFQTDGIFFWNERLEYEIIKRTKFSIHQSENSKKRWGEKSQSDAKLIPNESQNDADNDPKHIPLGNRNRNTVFVFKNINIAFDEFWDLYDKKVGDKEKLKKKWSELSDQERTKIIEHIPKYKDSQPEKRYRKDPSTYLNNKSWNDEIITATNGKHTIPPSRNSKSLGLHQVIASLKEDIAASSGSGRNS